MSDWGKENASRVKKSKTPSGGASVSRRADDSGVHDEEAMIFNETFDEGKEESGMFALVQYGDLTNGRIMDSIYSRRFPEPNRSFQALRR